MITLLTTFAIASGLFCAAVIIAGLASSRANLRHLRTTAEHKVDYAARYTSSVMNGRPALPLPSDVRYLNSPRR